VTALIIAANACVFLLELEGGEAFVRRWAVIPVRIEHGHHWITIVTAMFMHAGWLHILGNMVFLWAFGAAMEDAMGRFRYLAHVGGFIFGVVTARVWVKRQGPGIRD
jgi:membrane associated rhomboid family serine protease